MASELAPTGSPLWSLRTLPTLVPSGRVRVSPEAVFTFCREQHPLVVSGASNPGGASPSNQPASAAGDEEIV